MTGFEAESTLFAQFLRGQANMPLHARADIQRHLDKLRSFRNSGVPLLPEAECWLEMEIASIEREQILEVLAS